MRIDTNQLERLTWAFYKALQNTEPLRENKLVILKLQQPILDWIKQILINKGKLSLTAKS